MSDRTVLKAIFCAALAAVNGEALLRARLRLEDDALIYQVGATERRLDLPRGGRLLVIGAGKAAASMARGAEAVLGDRIDGGLVIAKAGHAESLFRIDVAEAGHPVPDAEGLAATESLLARMSDLTAQDRVLMLLSGGASALLVAPVAGVSLADKAEATRILLNSGAPIEVLNAVRRRLSRVKGGGLLRAIGPAKSLTLAISDVPGDRYETIGSGPMVEARDDPADVAAVIAGYAQLEQFPASVRAALITARPTGASAPAPHAIIAESAAALAAAKTHAEALDLRVVVDDAAMRGETHAAAHRFAGALIEAGRSGAPTVVLSAGETTLRVRGGGRGGRNQEFALVAAQALAGRENLSLLSAGTDGTDGPTEAAGAFADGATLQRAAALGIDVAARLADNDAHTVLQALGDLLVTGPTGTNVMDLVIGLAR